MNVESKQYHTASKLMEERRGNCAQAILTMYGPQLSLGKVDCDTCMRLASAFGGGINRTGNVCGAITGALMALGIKYGRDFQLIAKVSNQLIDEFTSINGSIICRDLIGHNLFDDEDVRKAFAEETFKKCKKYVDDAACLLEKYIDKHDIEEGD
jgi:C_GCAxxG_C_C family probable redox protein